MSLLCYCVYNTFRLTEAFLEGYSLHTSHTVNLLHCTWSRKKALSNNCSALSDLVASCLILQRRNKLSSKARMHLSMDTMGIVEDSCLDNYDMAKGAGSSAGGRVHSIDVILGFTKDQEPLLHSVGDEESQKTNMENPQHPEKQVSSDPYGHLPELGDSSQQASYHGESFQKRNYCHLQKLSNTLFQYQCRSGDFPFHCATSGIRAVLSLSESPESGLKVLPHSFPSMLDHCPSIKKYCVIFMQPISWWFIRSSEMTVMWS